ncbi:complex I 51 kDa subunit family protein [Desulfurobacterium atlanticum]|uniref:NADH-quinone oxidoreductase subunit F n=1 Tax=Desulfurobacterium atlanticum TaxID=240169 RepID=A0A238YWC5_9BACT|nr:NADH-ubiquinone oxidoreductase-F iron-sulfur binding region domain-containing protein [Desulfurobacterium atlanticum]SNR74819.1 NADH-quinone oxidoreductase subunit F [Desulfurobacterium atlanticum]
MIDFKVIGEPIILKNARKICPENIEKCIEAGRYSALKKALTQMTPLQVIEEVKKSQLRGRGGAGFPTGLKLELAAKESSDVKYIVVNGEEGEPGTFKDRIIMEDSPHLLIEGTILAGYAVGAKKAIVCIRCDYVHAIKRMEKAIKDAYEKGFLGENIFGTDFSFDMVIERGAGAYICGEETALLEMIEGKRGEPRKKPPFPPQKGLYGKPTVVNNVETLANLPFIINEGADRFLEFGVEGSHGTKLFSLSGDINWRGLIEIPFGATLREIINLAGGIRHNRRLKAVILGGVSGTLVRSDEVDIPVDYKSLGIIEAGPGCGTVIVLDETRDIVDVAENIMEFFKTESCGKCRPCSLGTVTLCKLIHKIKTGEGTVEDLEKIEKVSIGMRKASFCGLGQTAPNIVYQSIQKFKEEWLAHIKGGNDG